MKVLFFNDFKSFDYQSDMIYHGLIDAGFEVYETEWPGYMREGYDSVNLKDKFSLYGKLNHIPRVDHSGLIYSKIRDHFYDAIVYGNIRKYTVAIDEIIKDYKRKEIHFIDGADDQYVIRSLHEDGILWKRELINNQANPISFAIPESQIITDNPTKEKLFGHVIPGDYSTYIFKDEKSYYEDYAKSYYGYTWKKSGWDCLRHYEILANGCIPFFPGLEHCPINTMSIFPKKLILETNNYASRNEVHPNYDEIREELLDYTKKYLTTKALANKILKNQ